MNISYIANSRFLKKEDLNGTPALVTIEADVWQENMAMEDSAPEMKYVIKFLEFDKPMSLNTTNAQLIAQALNEDDTANWVGRQVVAFVDPTVMMKGKIVGGIRFRASKKPQPANKPVTVVGKPVNPVTKIDEEDMPF